ncbi:MAG: GNAT family protein [Clostridiaceae bacterium]
MKTIETARIILRSWKLNDFGDFYEYASDPSVGPSAGWKPHTDPMESLNILISFIEGDEVFAIEDKISGKAIGSIGLHPDRKRNHSEVRMIGYVLAKPYWGRGLASEAVKAVLDYAFNEQNLKIVSVYHFPFNLKSKRVIEKAGFSFEGILRDASLLPSGEIVDDVCYSLTKEEYISRLV